MKWLALALVVLCVLSGCDDPLPPAAGVCPDVEAFFSVNCGDSTDAAGVALARCFPPTSCSDPTRTLWDGCVAGEAAEAIHCVAVCP